MQEEEVCLKTLDGQLFFINKKTLIKHSPYFEALFRHDWEDSKKSLFSVEVDSGQLERILEFVFDKKGFLEQKDHECLSFLFPGTPFFRNKLELDVETCKLMFSQYDSVFIHECGREYSLYQDFFFGRGFIVMEPSKNDVSFRDAVLSIENFSFTECSPAFSQRERVTEIDGFWLWCHCSLFEQETFGQELFHETGLIVIPIREIIPNIFRAGANGGTFVSFNIPNRNAFVVLCEEHKEDGLSPPPVFAKYEKDEEWMTPFKIFTLTKRISLSRGFLIGRNFPKNVVTSTIKTTTRDYFSKK